jgi:hypothetical protein
MAAAIRLRGDYDAGALRVAAKRSKDGLKHGDCWLSRRFRTEPRAPGRRRSAG